MTMSAPTPELKLVVLSQPTGSGERSRTMIIIGVDFHPEFQQMASVDTDTGEFQEQRLRHREEAECFYRQLAARAVRVRVGMEASGHARWLERLLSEQPLLVGLVFQILS